MTPPVTVEFLCRRHPDLPEADWPRWTAEGVQRVVNPGISDEEGIYVLDVDANCPWESEERDEAGNPVASCNEIGEAQTPLMVLVVPQESMAPSVRAAIEDRPPAVPEKLWAKLSPTAKVALIQDLGD